MTPRGAVMGFLAASRKGSIELAVLYLNTRLRGQPAHELAHQLYVVLNRRLPAKLQTLSDRPEGSLVGITKPGQDLVGTISTPDGDVEIIVEKVNRGTSGDVWLFSRETLSLIPGLYKQTSAASIEDFLPAVIVKNRLFGVPLFHWLGLFVGLPLLYMAAGVLNRLLGILAGRLGRRLFNRPDLRNPTLLSSPVRLLLLPLSIYWAVSRLAMPLFARQVWSAIAAFFTIGAFVWLFIVWNGRAELYLRRRLERRRSTGAASIVRFARRAIDFLAIFAGFLVILRYFGVNPTAALAGLGVGGIAVALAAQKTLENVIGGFSIIMDKVVHVGEYLKCGDTSGTVEEVGLRSTRIRTMDRTLVSIPNGQIANLSLEAFSVRDKFWLRHILGLRYDTTAAQMRTVLESLHNLLAQHPQIERDSPRVRFLRFGTSSLELEVFAYVLASDFAEFLQVQSDLLLQAMEAVQAAGTHIAMQTPVITSPSPSPASARKPRSAAASNAGSRRKQPPLAESRVANL
jgi:MscS family membrane protein